MPCFAHHGISGDTPLGREVLRDATKVRLPQKIPFHPVMWVWEVNPIPERGRWLLAVNAKAYRDMWPWHFFDAVTGRPLGGSNGADLLDPAFYSHHTPIYAPRSTPT